MPLISLMHAFYIVYGRSNMFILHEFMDNYVRMIWTDVVLENMSGRRWSMSGRRWSVGCNFDNDGRMFRMHVNEFA